MAPGASARMARGQPPSPADPHAALGRLHSALQRKPPRLSMLLDLSRFSLGNLQTINPGHAASRVMHAQHDLHGLLVPLVKELLENLDHELHGRVVVVV